MERVPVAIVGGGPVGLVAALELARYGIRSLLVERHEGTTWHPKARNLNTRTMEIARGWGAAVHDALVSINLPRAWTSQIIYTRTLAGEELGRMPTAGFSGPGHDVSPEVPLLSSQDVFEPIFRKGAEATGMADMRFGHEAGRLLQGGGPDDDRAVIEVTERATGKRYEVEAEFLLAADGSASGVREQLGDRARRPARHRSLRQRVLPRGSRPLGGAPAGAAVLGLERPGARRVPAARRARAVALSDRL